MVKRIVLILGFIYLAQRINRLEETVQDYFDSLLLRDVRLSDSPDEYTPFSELLKEFNIEIPGFVEVTIDPSRESKTRVEYGVGDSSDKWNGGV